MVVTVNEWVAIAGLLTVFLGQFGAFIWWASRLSSRVDMIERNMSNDIAGRRAFIAVREDVSLLKQHHIQFAIDLKETNQLLGEMRKDLFGILLADAKRRPTEMDEGDK